MHRFRRFLSLLLCVCLLWAVCVQLLPALAAETILSPNDAHGQDYTTSTLLAQALDRVFAGDVDIYTDLACTAEVSMPLGTRMNNKTQYYIQSKTTGSKISGWQCYIYANAVYNYLFREWVGHAAGFSHSETLITGGNTLTYQQLKNANVRCGAYLRTTGNADGSYNSSDAHSMILLSYNETGITYLEGNADGNGLVRITTRTWSEFVQNQLTNKGRYIAHIVQPKAAVYDQWYSTCSHGTYDALGNCTACAEPFNWQGTFYAGAAGSYRVTEDVTARKDAPYETATAGRTLLTGEVLELTGTCQNAFGAVWYVWTDGEGNRCFVPSGSLELLEMVAVEVVCSDFSPVNHALLERKSQPVKGTVTSNVPLKTIRGYLDGQLFALWTAPDTGTTSVNLQATDINKKLSFSTLTKGRHTVRLEAECYGWDQTLTIHESVFYMEEVSACTHSYQSEITRAPACTVEGLRTYTCDLCGDSYVEALPAIGHIYGEGQCTLCGALERVQLSGTVESLQSGNEPVTVLLRQGTEVVAQTTATGLQAAYSLPDLEAGIYTLELRKTGCVTRTAFIRLEGQRVEHNSLLLASGDVNPDGRVNVIDAAKLYSHIRGSGGELEPYVLKCADMDGSGSVNIIDMGKLYKLVKG